MAGAGRIKRLDSGNAKVRYQYAAILAAIGATLLFIGIKFNTKDYLIPAKVQRHSEHGFTRIWLDDMGLPVGATLEGSRLSVWSWSGVTREIELGAAAPLWTMAQDLSRMAWIAEGSLHSRSHPLEAKESSDVTAPLPADRKALALTELSDGTLAVVFDDASVGRWSPDGRLLGQDHVSFDSLEQAVADGDYVALGSSRSGSIFLYEYRPGEEWKVVDREPAPDLPFHLVIPAPGMTAALSEAGLHRGGKTQNTPGEVRSAASHLEDFLITGDFDKLLVLPADGDRYPLADAQPGSLVAASHNRTVVSGTDGTRLIELGTETRLTASGRALTTIAAVLLAGALLLCFAPLIYVKLLDLLAMKVGGGKRKDGGKLAPRTLGQPPPQLIDRFAAGEGVAWAGAGLSAQSGLPLRGAFVMGLLQTAQVEKLAPLQLLRRLEKLAEKGEIETALDELAAAAPQRAGVIAHYRAVYYKYVARSHAHELLSRLPLAGAITTNYDGLLSCGDDAWSSHVLTLSSLLPERPDAPFLLKLYGDIPAPLTVLLSRAEFAMVFPKSSVAHIPRVALAEQTLLFIGCSMEGLVADLQVIGAPEKIARTHFAAVGVAGPDWTKHAAVLKERFGIEVLPCSEETIAEALPQFLETLAAEIENRQNAGSAAQPELIAQTKQG
jgi:hypothetical protein